MTPELFGSLLEVKSLVTVVHNQDEHRSFIQSDDEKLGWHMDEAPEDLAHALFNLEALMAYMGWEMADLEWGIDPDHPEIFFADFEKTDG